MKLELPGLRLKSNNELQRMNRYARDTYNKWVRRRIELEATVQGFGGYEPTEIRKKVRIVIYHKGSYDRDGRYGAAKPVLDGIVARPAQARVGKTKIKLPKGVNPGRRWGFVFDDSEKYVDLVVDEVKSDGYSVIIEVEDPK